ncbi:hypothetical protein ACLMJK_004491 [Lecanora helva]
MADAKTDSSSEGPSVTYRTIFPASRLDRSFQWPSPNLDREQLASYHTSSDHSTREHCEPSNTDPQDLSSTHTFRLRRTGPTCTLTREKASDLVRCFQSFAEETSSKPNAMTADLVRMTEDAKLYRFHLYRGDYAGSLCDALKRFDYGPSILRQPWSRIVPNLDSEDAAMVQWEATDSDKPAPKTPFRDALVRRAATLTALGWGKVDIDIALFAIRAYARRNYIAHGKTRPLLAEKEYSRFVECPEADRQALTSILHKEERQMADKIHIFGGMTRQSSGFHSLLARVGAIPLYPADQPGKHSKTALMLDDSGTTTLLVLRYLASRSRQQHPVKTTKVFGKAIQDLEKVLDDLQTVAAGGTSEKDKKREAKKASKERREKKVALR